MGNLTIGQEAYGGIVFNVDESGNTGLVCSVKDMEKTYTWDNANSFCNELVESGYDDWRLPSQDELKMIYKNLQQSGKHDFGVDFFWGQQFDAGNGWTIHFNNGVPEPYTKYGHYLGKVLPVRRITNAKYVVEMLGRRGAMEFSGPMETMPTTATIKLYGLTTSDVKTYTLSNGSWTNGKFMADITGGVIKGISATNPVLKLKFTSGTYKIIGLIGPKSYINSGSWSNSAMSIVLGYDWDSSQGLLPKTSLPDAVYTTVIFDKASFPDHSNPSQYDYGWWMEPTERKTKNFTALTLLWDGIQKELALYKFDDGASLSNDPGILNKYKIHAYNYGEINEQLKEFITKYYYVKYPFPDLTALLLNEAMQIAPSKILGLASSGHGSPEGIMNGIVYDKPSIQGCFSWVKDLRNDKPIDFFDFGTNCNVASLYNMQAIAPYANYVVASDLTRNSPSTSFGKRPSDNYSSYFNDSSKEVKTILSNMLDVYDQVYNDDAAEQFYRSPQATQNGLTLSGWKEQLTLFDCSQFPTILAKLGGESANQNIIEKLEQHADLFYPEESWQQADFKTAVAVCYPEYGRADSDWANFAIKQMSNRRSLTWDTDAPKGLLVKADEVCFPEYREFGSDSGNFK